MYMFAYEAACEDLSHQAKSDLSSEIEQSYAADLKTAARFSVDGCDALSVIRDAAVESSGV